MKTIKCVIGTGYGDEGKGLTVDYLAHKHPEALVVRFNGGAQAGHTVTLKDGRQHVFSHIGAGALAGSDTYLSEFFISNPILFNKEYSKLQDNFGISPKVFVHKHSRITTPFDMMLNQFIENKRSDGRHGSVGVGIYETICRNWILEYELCYDRLLTSSIVNKFKRIQQEYIPIRLAELGLSYDDFNTVFSSDLQERVLRLFIDEYTTFMKDTEIIPAIPQTYDTYVFEGGQGLLLDEDHGTFPHLTPSSCGMKNIALMLPQLEDSELDTEVIYVSRVYTTKHGAGELPMECSRTELGVSEVDTTNTSHDFQGDLRYAPLDLCRLRGVVGKDSKYYPAKTTLMLTCLDQVDEIGLKMCKGIVNVKQKSIADYVDDYTGIDVGYASYGKSREFVQEVSF